MADQIVTVSITEQVEQVSVNVTEAPEAVAVSVTETEQQVSVTVYDGKQGEPGEDGTDGSDGATGATGADGIGTAQSVGDLVNSLTAKTTPVDADMVGLMDSAASNIWKKLSIANLKAYFLSYFDTKYQSQATYKTLFSVAASITAGAGAAAKAFHNNGGAVMNISAGQLSPPVIFAIRSADYPAATGLAVYLRLCAQVNVNAVAPASDFTFGLYKLTAPAGTAGIVSYTWTLVAASVCSVSAPAANSINLLVGSDFALPSDGIYAIAVVNSGAPTASSHMHLAAQLQIRQT